MGEEAAKSEAVRAENVQRILDYVEGLRRQNETLLAAIRRHRDYRGDDRCYQDDGELYAVLPEGDNRPERETAVTLMNCERYIRCRQGGREYVSPQRRIEELEAEVRTLREQLGQVRRDDY